ncbi:hypothetical protein BIV57_19200 [Mangrovactinospora gilvigrisea]|uniref:DUF8094 domain-containing protein n=1 Tax=Mangrovactinospora gilvigrisea TaxID=1428644 RepID=A0A1J7C2Q7_9ACTN|nr:hypothetical protein [Mangrovactinospora gilvigrisea]OIV35848.1 hypothetical protein BIV57_19200 [Mangrovactinospora gilvigrisea]
MTPRHRLVRAAALAVTALTLTACTTTHPTATPSPAHHIPAAQRPLVTRAQAQRILDHYVRVNNQANAKLADAPLRTIETDPLLAIDEQANRQLRTYSRKDQAEDQKPFYYTKPVYYIPAAGHATWFAVEVTGTGPAWKPPSKRLLIFDHTGAAGYKMATTVDLTSRLPRIATDRNSCALVSTPSTTVTRQFQQALADLYDGGHSDGTLFGTSPARGWITNDTKDTAKHLAPYADAVYRDISTSTDNRRLAGRTYALATADGGILAVTLDRVQMNAFPTSPTAYIKPGRAEAAYTGHHRLDNLTVDYAHQTASYVSSSGQARLLGLDRDVVQATGVSE